MKKALQETITISPPDTQKSVSEQSENLFSEASLKKDLSTIHRVGGQRFYFLDYRQKKIIADSSLVPFLCGHSMELLNQEGFDFLNHVLDSEELAWLSSANRAVYSFLSKIPVARRKGLTFSYDLTFLSVDKPKENILHHKITPLHLCENGDLWLALCSVSASTKKTSRQAFILDTYTDEYYEFIGNEFVKTTRILITKEEKIILSWLVKGLSAGDIGEKMGFCSRTVERKLADLYGKIKVRNATQAVHWAHLEGLL